MAVETPQQESPAPVIRVANPRTGEELYTAEEPSMADVDRVYDRARAAFEKFRVLPLRERLAEIGKLKRYLIDNREHVVERIVEETGKCRTDALMLEIVPVIDAIAFYEKNAERMLAERKVKTPALLFGKKSKVYYEPMGVVLVISPWNYPFHLSFMPALCALAAGNAVILKPSKYTPLKGVMEEMVEKSGFLDGAFQVVYASRRTAGRLIERRPAKIHFTGSVDAGRKVMSQAGEHLIPVELELGGKDPCIIFDDVNLDRTVTGAIWGSMVNCGQTCTSIERIYVQDTVFEKFVGLLKEKAEKLKRLDMPDTPGDDRDLGVGCMTTNFQIEEIEEQLEEAKARGAAIVCGGAREGKSHVFPPTIITGTDHSMKLQYYESFGPVVTVMPFKTEDEAIRLANDSPYGLSASVWSTDLDRADRVARALHTGNVSINNAMATQGNPALPFGGVLDSGFGRYKGEEGLYGFSNIKSILVDKQSGRTEFYWYPYSKEKYGLLSSIIDAMYGIGGLVGLLKSALIGLKLDKLNKRDKF